MTALAADILLATREARIVQREDAAVKTDYPGARDNLENPSQGYFDDPNDATAALNIEGALTGVFRRRFAVRLHDVVTFDPVTDGVPSWTLIDAEQGANGVFLVGRVLIDFENETTDVELFG